MKWLSRITWVIVTVTSLFVLGAVWVISTWQNLTMDELMYQLSAPTEGTGSFYYISAALKWLLPVLFLSVVFFFLLKWMKKTNRKKGTVCILVTSILVNVFTNIRVWDLLDIAKYIEYQNHPSTFIEDMYADPKKVHMTFPEKKQNLIYLYLESMETTYTDVEHGGGFKEDVIPELTELALNNEDFSGSSDTINGAYSLPFTTFTMGAMFAQSSGLPLKNNLENNDMVTQSSFFGSTTCIGDILQQEGYTNVLLLGSNATFGGRRTFYTQHGNYDIFDYVRAKKEGVIPDNYKVWWGYEDEKLFQYAKEALEQLSTSSQPFNLTMLTVDTHFENGYLCKDCPTTFGKNRYANVMACSSKRVSEFIDWCKQQDWYENTTIVVVGDHPTMDSDFCDRILTGYQRRAYVAYIHSAAEVEEQKERVYSTLDAFPTTLASLGVKIEGNRLGLGVNLFSQEPTILEQYGLGYVTEEIEKKSVFMEKKANIDFGNEALKKRQSYSRKEDHGTTVYDTD